MTNLKLAFRRLAQSPFVTLVAVLSLGLGIGANAAIFSLFDQILLRALPVSDPDSLVNLAAPGPMPGSQSCGQAGPCDAVFSYPMFRDLEKSQTVFSGLAAHVGFGANLAYRGQTTSGSGMLVSGSYFPVLGTRAEFGRLLTQSDDESIGNHYVVVLSHAYWTSQLGANPAVLNDTITINGKPMTVVGVAARGFSGTTLGSEPDVFVPLAMRAQMISGWNGFENRRMYFAYLFGRLKTGMSIEQAATGLNVLYSGILNDVEAPLQQGMSEQTLQRFRAKKIVLTPGQRGQSTVHREARVPLLMLLAITAVVLLIACANIANLLLARGAARSTEMAVRLSIGASRQQLLAQLLTESCLLALIGGVFSLLVAKATLGLMSSLLPPDAVESLHFTLNPSVVLFAMAVSLGTGVLFGLFPALHSTRPDLVSTLKAQAGQPSGARAAAQFRTVLVTAQIALSMALLMSAGLFVKSLINVSRVDLGIDIDNVITFGISPVLNGYEPARSKALFISAEQELAALPGVTAVSVARVAVLAGSSWGNDVSVQGFEAGPDTDTNSRFNEVGPGYLRTLGMPLIAGREFTDADVVGSPEVAIVNEAFAKKFNLGRDAVGKRMTQASTGPLDTEIVGLVRDAKYNRVKGEVPPLFFRPYRQNERIGAATFYVRTAGDPAAAMSSIRSVMARLDPNLPLEEMKTLPEQARESVFMDRMISTLSASFAVLATILAAIGLYGVLAYTVAQRTREFGLRMALGADGARVRRLVLRQVALMTAIGGLAGVAAALALGRKARELLYEMQPTDPIVIAASIVVLTLVALAAGYIPALRASRVEPMSALRYE
jgi:predicted permease